MAQMLKAAGKDLYYHTIRKPDGKGYYEIDFLQSDGSKVSPIEDYCHKVYIYRLKLTKAKIGDFATFPLHKIGDFANNTLLIY